MTKDPKFASSLPKTKPKSVDDVVIYDCQGPFSTKIGAELFVGINFPVGEANPISCLPEGMRLEDFLKIDKVEEKMLVNYLKESRPDFNYGVGSLRIYFQNGMLPGKTAGNEFHRIRREVLLTPQGKVEAKFEDVYGGKRIETLDKTKAITVPPFVIHSINPKERSSMISVVNTLFYHHHNSEKIEISDTYSRETFEKLKEFY